MAAAVEEYRVRVIPAAPRNAVRPESGGGFRVYLVAAPEKGRANKALVKILADHLKVRKSCLEIVSGERSRNKTVRVTRP